MGIGQEPMGVKTVDGSRFWAGVYTYRPFLTVAPGEPGVTMVSNGLPNLPPTNLEIADGVLYGVSQDGLFRMPGGLPTAADTTTVPQSVLPLQGAFDVAFVDTDGVDGSDTAYFTRGDRGLWKFVRSGDTWVARGAVFGSFNWVTARAVAGAVELYVTNRANTRVQKIVDTAEIGAPLATTGVTTIGRAPSRVRYTGLAFSPGAGFPADSTPYPATPPSIQSSTSSTVDTHVGAKVSIELDVFDPNTPASELTVTASSSDTTALPNDRIAITGEGATRTVTFDPAASGSSNVTFTVRAGDETGTVVVTVRTSGAPPEPTGHYYSGAVDLSAAVDAGDGYFLGVSDEVNRDPPLQGRRIRRAAELLRPGLPERRDRLRGRHPLRRHDRLDRVARQQPLGLRAPRAPLPGVHEGQRPRRRHRPGLVAQLHAPVGPVEGVGRGQRPRPGREQAEVRHGDRPRPDPERAERLQRRGHDDGAGLADDRVVRHARSDDHRRRTGSSAR